ncbi:hypothetical protein BV25DRAFT_1823012 [Artomyces pyxidatus]|uniref:Uncharacterized protein n=1 Tax=Artomyces pyxidatus TaxID=48021 RepID=A0ACB8T762_9AGAM|nr:hypothetical protein BV25DRAFT_1823012 [Artomyces pyxidatus]
MAYDASAEREDVEYDAFLWWPSLTEEQWPEGLSYHFYGPIPPSRDFEDYDDEYEGLEYLGRFPYTSRSPYAAVDTEDVDDTPLQEDALRADAEAPEPHADQMAGHSKLVKLGLFFSRITHGVDRFLDRLRMWQPRFNSNRVTNT